MDRFGGVIVMVLGANVAWVACVAPDCGKYVITSRTIGRLEEGGPKQEVLVEMTRLANERERLLDISVASDGLLQTAGILSAA